MKRIYQIRREALLLAIFALGVLVSGRIPDWFIAGFLSLSMRLYMRYDDAVYDLRQEGGKRIVTSRSVKSRYYHRQSVVAIQQTTDPIKATY